jgi:NTP pyrophosphatase (non-canonical NTP hydrolase)
METNFNELIENVIKWADVRNILQKDNAKNQMLKVVEELGETASAIAKNKPDEIKDGIGDVFVTLIILSKQLGLHPNECLQQAWNEIKDRTGKTINGVFIKD